MVLLPFRPSRSTRFEKLVQPHLQGMYRFAFRLCGQQQDAEDLVQDVVVKLFPRLEELESVDHLRPWLNRVLYRHFIDQVRRRGRQADRPVSEAVAAGAESAYLDSFPSEAAGPEQLLNLNRLGPVLDAALATLAPDQRTLILLHDADGWRQEELAEVLEVPVGTVKSRLHRCRATLRKKLQRELEPFSGPGRVKE
ncbi:MAG: RNA polymerase sigma factor [Pseudomonadota bacterium]